MFSAAVAHVPHVLARQRSVPDGLSCTQAQQTHPKKGSEPMTCEAEASKAVVENCRFTKSVASELTPVAMAVMVSRSNC